MDTMMLNVRNLFEQLVRRVEILSEGNENLSSWRRTLRISVKSGRGLTMSWGNTKIF
ncbi:RACGAP1 isoform 19 [Pan troglodytes]|uniref:RACGAP1 isoform 19 n=1 Tax=Pan troglodytes TaxID=9598 RepID=A0A2J8KE88_PANTR|nr:RACGAP1 isoform 19 [Pan troglodytes]